MTREEAKEILTHNWTRVDNPNYSESELDEAFFMAIEALSERNIARDIATILENEQDMRVILQNEVVRCKDCIHWKADNEVFELGFCCVFPQKWVAETFYCADGERREE